MMICIVKNSGEKHISKRVRQKILFISINIFGRTLNNRDVLLLLRNVKQISIFIQINTLKPPILHPQIIGWYYMSFRGRSINKWHSGFQKRHATSLFYF